MTCRAIWAVLQCLYTAFTASEGLQLFFSQPAMAIWGPTDPWIAGPLRKLYLEELSVTFTVSDGETAPGE